MHIFCSFTFRNVAKWSEAKDNTKLPHASDNQGGNLEARILFGNLAIKFLKVAADGKPLLTITAWRIYITYIEISYLSKKHDFMHP